MLVTYDQNVDSLKLQDSPSDSIQKTNIQIEKYNKQSFNGQDDDEMNPFPEEYDSVFSKEQLIELYNEMFPFDADLPIEETNSFFKKSLLKNGIVSLDDLEKNKRKILEEIKASMPKSEWRKYNFFAMKDLNDEDFEKSYEDIVQDNKALLSTSNNENEVKYIDKPVDESPIANFSFDYQPDLQNHPGPSPSIILQVNLLLYYCNYFNIKKNPVLLLLSYNFISNS